MSLGVKGINCPISDHLTRTKCTLQERVHLQVLKQLGNSIKYHGFGQGSCCLRIKFLSIFLCNSFKILNHTTMTVQNIKALSTR